MPPRLSPIGGANSSPTFTNFHRPPQWLCWRCECRSFTSTIPRTTRLRREMFSWLNGPGAALKEPLPGSTNYMGAYDKRGKLLRSKKKSEASEEAGRGPGDNATLLPKETIQDLRPFPHNYNFYSQSVLSEDLRNEIYRRVKERGQPVRLVSAQLGVEMRRVGAVVRLVEIEQRWKAEGKQLAIPYARAVHEMVPTTPYTPDAPAAHEPINDLPIHSATNAQIFWPTSESRRFNRTDAGRVFSGAHRLPDSDAVPSTIKPEHFESIGKPGHERQVLLPADARIPHPHLVDYHRDVMDPDIGQNKPFVMQRYNERINLEIAAQEEGKEKLRVIEEKRTNRVASDRWDFVFRDVQTTREGTGVDGRGTQSPGFRYGVPKEDRKKGQVKIPIRVAV